MADYLFSLEFAVDACGGKFVGPALDGEVFGVSIDTRSIKAGDLFVALPGENADGHDFLLKAFAAGSCCALVKQASWEKFTPGFRQAGPYILVEEPLEALQNLARRYLENFPSLLKVAVTGSNGKTSTRDMIASILSEWGSTYVTRGNFNSEIGLPLSVFGLRSEHVYGVFELGSNRKGEIALLSDLLKPSVALVTNIGTAHIGMFGSREAIAEEKAAVFSCFDSSSRGLVWENEPFAAQMVAGKPGTFSFFGPDSTDGIESLESRGVDGGVLVYRGRSVALNYPGYHNLINACAAVSVAQVCGASDDAIAAGLEKAAPAFGRGQILKYEDLTILQDCYNANFESLAAGIASVNDSARREGRRIGVLGAMKELGEYAEELHDDAGRLCADSGFDAWFFFGEEANTSFERYRTACGAAGFYYDDFDSLDEKFRAYLLPGDFVYLKGSRSTGLERLAASVTAAEKEGSNA